MLTSKLQNKTHALFGLALLAFAVLFPLTAIADTPNDVRAGMPIEDATRVAIRCIQAASRMKTRDIRLQDTLNFVGINDEMRVDALRRHIVRNPNIGVPSVIGKLGDTSFHYLIVNDQLADIDTKSTVAKLAQTISAKAGLPRLSYSRVGQMIALCRKGDTNIPSVTPILGDANKPPDFTDCLSGKKIDGKTVRAAVSDPTGHRYQYWIDKTWLERRITDGVTYAAVIREIADTVCPKRRATDTTSLCLETVEAGRIQKVTEAQDRKKK